MVQQGWASSHRRVRSLGLLGCALLALIVLFQLSIEMIVHALYTLSSGGFVLLAGQVARTGVPDFAKLSMAMTCSLGVLGVFFAPFSIICASSRRWCFSLNLCLDVQPWCGASHNGLTWFGVSSILLAIAALRFSRLDRSVQWAPSACLSFAWSRVVAHSSPASIRLCQTIVGATAPSDSSPPRVLLDTSSTRINDPSVFPSSGPKRRRNEHQVAHRTKDGEWTPNGQLANNNRVAAPVTMADKHPDDGKRWSSQQVSSTSGAVYRFLLIWAGMTVCVVWLAQVWLRASPVSTTTAPGDAVLAVSGAYAIVVGVAGIAPSWRFGILWAVASAVLLLATQGPQLAVGLLIFGPPPAAINIDLCTLEPLAPRGRGGMSADGSIGVGKVWNNEWWPDCFDRAPCGTSPDDFRVYVYPDSAVRDDMASPTRGGLSYLIRPDYRFDAMLAAIRALPYVTSNPADACVLVPSLHTHGVFTRGLFQFLLTQSLRALPTWNEGRNHLLIGDTKDDGCTEPWVDYAMVQRSAWSKTCYRPAFDSTLLLVPHDHRTASKIEWDDWVTSAVAQLRRQDSAADGGRKRFEAFFKGSCYTDKHRTREILHRYVHDPSKGVIARCTDLPTPVAQEAGRVQSSDADREAGKRGVGGGDENRWSYDDMMRNSTFCLLPKGHGSHSFRMFEAMLSGCIPVLLTDDLVLPWEDLLPWQKVSVRVPQSLARNVAMELRKIPDAAVRAMQRNLLLMVEGIGRVESQINLTMASLQNRIYGKSTVQRHLSPELLELIAA